jgi:integrase
VGVITDKQLQAKPGAKDIWLMEDGPRGAGRFVARITPAGERLFYYRYTDPSGDRVRLPLGSYPAMSVKQARTKFEELSALYRAGNRDLREYLQRQVEDEELAREQRRRELAEAEAQAEAERNRRKTFLQVFEQWRATELQPRVRADGKRIGRKDGGQYVAEQFQRHVFPTIGDVPIEDITKADLLALLDTQTIAGKSRTANVLLADLKQMLAFALEREVIKTNPLASVKKNKIGGKDTERERVLSVEEIKLLATRTLPPRLSAAIWLTLATGARVGELMGAAWADALPTDANARREHVDALLQVADSAGCKFGIVDLDNRSWYLPTTKNQRDHTIHLSAFAAEQFTRLRQLREAQQEGTLFAFRPWIFPAADYRDPVEGQQVKHRRPVHIKSFGKQLADRQRRPEARLQGRTQQTQALLLPGGHWTAHDLRRTAATRMADLGISTDIIDECLNHVTSSRMAKVYVRSRRLEDQERAFDALGGWLQSLLAGNQAGGAAKAPAGEVVPMRRRQANV